MITCSFSCEYNCITNIDFINYIILKLGFFFVFVISNMQKSLLILFSYLFIVLEAVARAGYGGGGSSGGGSYSGGGYSRYSSGGGAVAVSGFSFVHFLILCSLFPLVYFLAKVYYNRKVKKSFERANELLQLANDQDDFWNESRLKEQVKEFFNELQSHWSSNDLQPMKSRISKSCYGKLYRELGFIKRTRRYNLIDQISFSNIQIIGVRDYIDDRKDSFSVLIEGKMLDEVIPIGKDVKRKFRKEFVDIYEFKRALDDKIILNRILPYKSVYDGVIKNEKE